MEQAEFRMPATGESWRKNTDEYPSLFTIIGMAHDATTGAAMVVYTQYRWGLVQLPPLYVIPLADFMAMVPDCRSPKEMAPRFRFEREVGDDDKCPFIRPEPDPLPHQEYDRIAEAYYGLHGGGTRQ